MLYGRPGGRRGRSVGQNGRCDDSVSVSSPSFASSSKRLAAELGSARRTLWSGPEAWRAPALGPTTIRAGAPTPSAGDARDEAVTAEAEANDAAAAAVRRSAPNSAVKCRHQNDIDRGDTDISRAGSMANRRRTSSLPSHPCAKRVLAHAANSGGAGPMVVGRRRRLPQIALAAGEDTGSMVNED
eukprot:TRINITY_DN10467_c0_g1_i3.p2 TRINITY_DN10467_c0_g1~~TRINITY_DN10467_c0_g1_i3.p2  ORF type:complete len:185 (+),score=33.43 TRINITY_DN10467_c0_g1_i3:208-762(+)